MIVFFGAALLVMIMMGGGLAIAWAAGMMNPIGWLGVPPWRVPACTCSAGTNRGMELHADDCAVTRLEPEL